MHMYVCVCVCMYVHMCINFYQITLVMLGREGSPSNDVRPTLIADSVAREVKLSSRPTRVVSRTLSNINSVICIERGRKREQN